MYTTTITALNQLEGLFCKYGAVQQRLPMLYTTRVAAEAEFGADNVCEADEEFQNEDYESFTFIIK